MYSSEKDYKLIAVAALIHDLGHSISSHLFDDWLSEQGIHSEHEEILTDYAKDVGMTAKIVNKALLEKKKINHPSMGIDLGMTLYECNKVAGRMYDEFGPIIHKFDVFICPTLSLPAVKADINLFKDKISTLEKAMEDSIQSEKYETAAFIRDRIKELKDR